MLRVFNLTRQVPLAYKVRLADTFWSRLVGLLNRKNLSPGEGLLINPCRGVHTWFMRFPIDVVFLDRDLRVVGVVENLTPYRCSPFFNNAVMTLELPVLTVKGTDTRLGDCLEIRGNDSAISLFIN